MNIYYVTRTWCDRESGNNCALLRLAYADILSEVGNVVVVTPAYKKDKQIIDNKIVSIYTNSFVIKIMKRLERMGIVDDYLDIWGWVTYRILKKRVCSDDVVYAVTGGDLGTIKLAGKIKQKLGCKMFINFRDPIDRVPIDGNYMPEYPPVKRRERIMDKWVPRADCITTWIDMYTKYLIDRYPEMKNRVFPHYIGYFESAPEHNRTQAHNPLNIVCAGNNNYRIIYDAVRGLKNVKLTIISKNPEQIKKEMPEDNIECIGQMSHIDYINYVQEYGDVGYSCLEGDFYSIMMPSKVMDFINIGIPILLVLPYGTATDFINNNKFGIAVNKYDTGSIRTGIEKLMDENLYYEMRKSIQDNRKDYYYINRKKEFLDIIKQFI